MAKLQIKKGDNVKVISGNNKGQSGRVLVIDVAKERVIVEGVNLVSKHSKPSAENPKGGIIKQEAGIHISNVMVTDKSGAPTRIASKVDEKTGKKVRISIKTGEAIK